MTYHFFRSLCISTVLLVPLTSGADYQPETGKNIGSITAVWERGYDNFQSGVFVTYTERGEIDFVGTQRSDNPYDDIYDVRGSVAFEEPTAIAQAGGKLYVWDRAQSALLVTDTFESRARVLTRDLQDPTEIVASVDGHIIVVDKAAGGIFYLADRGAENAVPFRIDALSELPDPRSVAFLAWNTLSVLDGREGAIFNFELYYKGDAVYASETRAFPLAKKDEHDISEFRVITAQNGTLYVADDSRVFSYVIETDELIPATPPGLFKDIRDLAVTYDNIYVLDANEVKPFGKTIPVDLNLSAAPEDSQTALMTLYMYLDRHGLLPTKRVRPMRSYNRLDEFLIEQNVLIAPEEIAYEEKGRFLFLGTRKFEARDDLSEGLLQFKYWYCRKNADFCNRTVPSEILHQPIRPDSEIEVPMLDVRHYLQRRRVDLAKETIEEFLDHNIVDAKLRESITPSIIKRFNRDLSAVPDERIMVYGRSSSIVLPAEAWAVTVNVPADDFYGGSEFDDVLDASDGISVTSRERFTQQTAQSNHDDEAIPHCDEIKVAHKAMLNHINYPLKPITSESVNTLETADVVIGVLEHSSQLDKNHMTFKLGGKSAWHQPVGASLSPEPIASSADAHDSLPVVGGFETTAHHGTHVAALIGGRKGHCWSGLLPSSSLVLIDVKSPAGIYEAIDKAFFADTKVFNVSQRLGLVGDDESTFIENIKKYLTVNFAEVLFVVSAGNADPGKPKGKDLNKAIDLPYPAALGDRENIITVTADFPRAHYGKRFVDLTTLGTEVFSATESTSFGPATGTSQATPLVAAAGAYLADYGSGNQTPGDVKARLIATATWDSDYSGKVWGGALDFGDAVRFHRRSILLTNTGDEDFIYSVVRPKERNKIKVEFGAEFHNRVDIGTEAAHGDYRQYSILSIRANNDDEKTYRVVLRMPQPDGRLKIILNAKLSGKIEAAGLELLDFGSRTFKPDETTGQLFYRGGIDVSEIQEYVRAMPYDVNW